MMPGECTDALNLIYGVEKCPKSQKCPKVPEVLKSAGPVNYNYPPTGRIDLSQSYYTHDCLKVSTSQFPPTQLLTKEII